MGLLPGLYTRAFDRRRHLINHHPELPGSDVVLDRTTRSPVAPFHRIPEGTVVVKQVTAPTFVAASDPRGARCRPAEIVAAQPADAAWANTIVTASLASGLGFPVLLDQAAVTTAAVVDQLNQSVPFASQFLADDVGGVVRIRTREAGAHKHLLVESTLPAAFGPAGAVGKGVDADYRVTDQAVELRDLEGNPIEAVVPSLVIAHFDESELLHLTPEARAVLARRGALFG